MLWCNVSAGDNQINRIELENMLSRLTADSGTLHGHKCDCNTCKIWRENVKLMEVDWESFNERFNQIDENENGFLSFGACAHVISRSRCSTLHVR